MKEKLYAEVSNGTESLLRAVSLLRRREFNVVGLDLKKRQDSDLSDLFITVEKTNGRNPYSAVQLMSKLVDFNKIKTVTSEGLEAVI